MTKEEALIKTRSKFTNLMDGKIISGVGVSTIIGYYEALLEGTPVVIHKASSGIVDNFQEEWVISTEADFWDGDETYKY